MAALEVARAIQDDSLRAQALFFIYLRYEGDSRLIILQEAMEAVRAIPHNDPRALALDKIASLLPLEQALEVMYLIPSYYSQAEILSDLAQKHDGVAQQFLKRLALEMVRSLKNDSDRAGALPIIIHLLPLDQGLELARSIKDVATRVSAMCAIIRQQEGEARQVLLKEVIEDAPLIPQGYSNNERAFRDLAPLLPLSQGLEMARSIHNENWRFSALRTITVQQEGELHQALLLDSLESSRLIHNDSTRDHALADLVPLLPLDQALEWTRLIQESSARADALEAISDRNKTLFLNPLPSHAILREWQKIIQYSATVSRPTFLNDLVALLTITIYLADPPLSRGTEKLYDNAKEGEILGAQLASEIAKAVQTVCSWWP